MILYKCTECGKVFEEEEIKEYHEDCTPVGEVNDTRWTYIYKGSPCCGTNYEDYEEEE